MDAPALTLVPQRIEELRRARISYSVEELSADPEPVRFLWDGLLPVGKVGVLAGSGGGGKTSLAVGLAAHRACGLAFLGRSVRTGVTALVSTEDGAEDYRRKLTAWRDVVPELDLAAIAERVHVFDLAGRPFSLVEAEFGQAKVSQTVDDLAGAILSGCPSCDLLILETVSRLGGGDESNGAMSALIVAAERLASLTRAAVLLVAHVSKAAARENTSDAYAARGGSAIVDNARSALVLSRLDEEQAERLVGMKLPADELADLLCLTPAKGNFAPKQRPIVLERVGTRWGLAVREYRPLGKGDPQEARRAWRTDVGGRLRGAVRTLHASGIQHVTENRLRDHLDLHGIAKGKLPAAVREALEDGFLAPGGSAPRGGGLVLLPGIAAGSDVNPPGNSPDATRPAAQDGAERPGREFNSPGLSVLGGEFKTGPVEESEETNPPNAPDSAGVNGRVLGRVDGVGAEPFPLRAAGEARK